jgi:fucose 4-O-acetylase-like acetyltransferase
MSTAARWLLSLAVLLELVAICLSNTALSAVAGLLFVVCFLRAGRRLQTYPLILLLVSLSVTAWFGFGGQLDTARLLKASADAAFYAAFLGSLGMMQCLVRRFEVFRRIHDILLGGNALWLYPKYALVSCGIASVLNFGMMNLLCGSLSETLRERGVTGESRLQWLRSVLISVLRGFALVPLVAPTSVAVAILTRELPQLSWSMLLPYGIAASMVLLGVGWLLEQRRFRRISSERAVLEQWPQGTLQLLVLVLAIFTVMAVLVVLTDLKVSAAAMLAVPSITLLYMVWRERSLATVLKESATQVAAMTNEMTIFAASAILGVALSSVIPGDALSGLVASTGGVWLVAVGGMLMLPLLSAIGVIPITVLSIQAGLLPQLIGEGMDPLLISVALVIGFSLAMMLSPFGPSVMLLSRFGQVSRWQIAFRWNGVFVMIAVPLLLALLALELVVLPTLN